MKEDSEISKTNINRSSETSNEELSTKEEVSGATTWRIIIRRFRRNQASLIGLTILGFFFSLALLIIEGIIGLIIATSNMTGDYQFYSICLMAFLFLVVVIAVIIITIKWPKHLYEEIIQELETSKDIKKFINSKGLYDVIEDILLSKIKPEYLIDNKKERRVK